MNVSKSSDIDREGVSFASLRFTKLGYIFREQPIVDIGVDAHLETKQDNSGTGKLVGLQLKSGLSFFSEEKDDSFIYRGDKAHLDYWLNHSLPIIIVLYHPEFEELYWEIVTKEKTIKTGKGWKLSIPKHQKVNIGMNVDIGRLVSKVSAFKNYTIASISDVSHNAAKRYSIRVVLNKEHTQLEILDLCKSLVIDVKQQVYYRSILTSDRWKKENAHVVWLLLYPSNEDEKNNNYIAHVQWISPNLNEKYSPDSLQGEDIGNGVLIEWNDTYDSMAKFYEENTISKADFMKETDLIFASINAKITEAKILINELAQDNIAKPLFSKRMFDIQKSVNENYHLGLELGIPPFECKDLGNQFQSVIASADNIVLPFSGLGTSNSRRFDLNYYRTYLQSYQESSEKHAFEREKV